MPALIRSLSACSIPGPEEFCQGALFWPCICPWCPSFCCETLLLPQVTCRNQPFLWFWSLLLSSLYRSEFSLSVWWGCFQEWLSTMKTWLLHIITYLIFLLHLFLSVWEAREHHGAWLGTRGGLAGAGSAFAPHGFRYGTQVIRFCSEHLYQLRHLVSILYFFPKMEGNSQLPWLLSKPSIFIYSTRT